MENIGRVVFAINLQKKNDSIIFPVGTEQASSLEVLLLWLYFEFPNQSSTFILAKRQAKKVKHCFYYAILTDVLPKYLVRQQGKGV